MWQVILITLAVDVGGLLLIYGILSGRVRRATSAASQVSELREEIDRLVVELNQTADRNIALIEDRIASLNDLAAVADKRIGLLRREIEKHDVGAQLYTRLGDTRASRPTVAAPSPPPSAPPSTPRLAGPSRAAPPEAVPAEAPVAASAPVPPAGPSPEPSSPPAQRAPSSEPMPIELSPRSLGEPDLRQRVLMLHRAGFSSALIATRVGAPRGEVELIIALEERKTMPSGEGVRRDDPPEGLPSGQRKVASSE